MSTKDTGEPAFPILERGGSGLELTHPGMTLRDYFAAKAIGALIAEPPWYECATSTASLLVPGLVAADERFARAAYKIADAMLKERAK